MQIKPLEFTDLEWVREQRNRPEINQYFNQSHLINRDEQEDWYRTYVLPKKFYAFVLWDSASTRVGYVSLRDINPMVRMAEFSIFVQPEHRGHGFGAYLINHLLSFGFLSLNLNKIYSTVFEFNEAIKFYQSKGFTIDGLLRDDCFKQGKFWNAYYISILRKDYERIYNSEQPPIH